ncbi:MAG: rRNA methyltransferase [Alphaproteobacteria bacterium CG_4_9_14_3_um_filter_47_13]|nr:MAG: rRNA methyltransferase [Alphaproteobacteria bacterium CG_4_9_14_3_um_filter_47_13]
MRGYFSIGVEGISKEGNVGNLVRSAHAFGASSFFTITPNIDIQAMRISDTSGAFDHIPYYQYENVEEMSLPKGCQLVGIELIEDSILLPSFCHPLRAAYVLGPEMGNLSPEILEYCAFTVKIPMKFCVNVGVAGALVMYDRMLSMGGPEGRFAERPARAGGPVAPPPQHTQGLRRLIRSEK